MTISRNQLRAARMLLCLSQEELAALASVGVATIRRFESGRDVGAFQVDTLRDAVKAAGVVLLQGDRIGGRLVGDGVALMDDNDLPAETLERVTRRYEPERTDAPRRSGRPSKVRPVVKKAAPAKKRRPTRAAKVGLASHAGHGSAATVEEPRDADHPSEQ